MAAAFPSAFMAGPPSYDWTFPGCPVRVQMHLAVIQSISRELDRDFGEKSAFVCGILTGGVRGSDITEIAGFHPLQLLNSTSVEEALERVRGKVVGFYRATSDRSLRLNRADITLANFFFHDPRSVVLLINGGPAPMGRFFLWHLGNLTSDDSSLAEFPFDVHQLQRAEWNESAGPETVRPAASSRRSVWVERVLWVSGTVLATGAALVFRFNTYELERPTKEPETSNVLPAMAATRTEKSPLALIAETRGADLLISWNPGSSAVPGAMFAMLSFRDGNANREILLTPPQLHSGHLVYSPTSDEVEIRLSVMDANQTPIVDSITVLIPRSRLGGALIAHASPADPVTVQRQPTASPVLTRLDAPRSAPGNSKEMLPFLDPLVSATTASQVRVDQVPLEPTLPEAISVEDKLPVLETPDNPQPQSPPLNLQQPPNAQVLESAAAGADFTPQTSDFHPPQAIKQVLPKAASLRSVILNPSVIQIKVSIDETGKVIRATLLSHELVPPALLSEALAAAHQWKFQPARVGDHALPSETILHFDIKPPNP